MDVIAASGTTGYRREATARYAPGACRRTSARAAAAGSSTLAGDRGLRVCGGIAAVVAVATVDKVGARAAAQRVPAGAAVQLVIATAADEAVVAAFAVEHVVPPRPQMTSFPGVPTFIECDGES